VLLVALDDVHAQLLGLAGVGAAQGVEDGALNFSSRTTFLFWGGGGGGAALPFLPFLPFLFFPFGAGRLSSSSSPSSALPVSEPLSSASSSANALWQRGQMLSLMVSS
jgi:hypothetical protein